MLLLLFQGDIDVFSYYMLLYRHIIYSQIDLNFNIFKSMIIIQYYLFKFTFLLNVINIYPKYAAYCIKLYNTFIIVAPLFLFYSLFFCYYCYNVCFGIIPLFLYLAVFCMIIYVQGDFLDPDPVWATPDPNWKFPHEIMTEM